MMPPGIRKALDIASQLAEIASDWHLDEVEIDGEMVSIYDVKDKFDAALALLDTLPAAPAPDWSKAPDWAMWWAIDSNGGAYWYEKEPKEDDYGAWSAAGGTVWDNTICPNWRETLVARPTEE